MSLGCKIMWIRTFLEKIGDNIEGNIYEINDGNYGKQIVLDMGDDENGEIVTTTLPSHKQLQNFFQCFFVGFCNFYKSAVVLVIDRRKAMLCFAEEPHKFAKNPRKNCAAAAFERVLSSF